MFLSGQSSDAVKIWPSNGEKYAWFRVIPEPENPSTSPSISPTTTTPTQVPSVSSPSQGPSKSPTQSPSKTPSPSPTLSPTLVHCDMTLDNVVTHVRYDGVDLEVEGALYMWTRVKHFSFIPVPGAILEIGGYEGASCNGCECSGLIVECSNGLITNLDDWEAIGFATSLVGPTSGYGDVCQSTSGMFLSGQSSDAVKIWPSNGEKYAWFRVIPEPVVPRDVVLENYWPTHSYLDAAWYKCKAPC